MVQPLHLSTGRVYHLLCHATSPLWTTSSGSMSSVHHRVLAGAASLSSSARPGVPIKIRRLREMNWTHHPSTLCRSSSPRRSLIFCCGVRTSRRVLGVNERERNNGLPCNWQVKPEVLHREHSLEADTPQLLEMHERHAELEIVPVAAVQRGAPNGIGGKPPPRVSGFHIDVSGPERALVSILADVAHVPACRD